jgi:hypothetical protein
MTISNSSRDNSADTDLPDFRWHTPPRGLSCRRSARAVGCSGIDLDVHAVRRQGAVSSDADRRVVGGPATPSVAGYLRHHVRLAGKATRSGGGSLPCGSAMRTGCVAVVRHGCPKCQCGPGQLSALDHQSLFPAFGTTDFGLVEFPGGFRLCSQPDRNTWRPIRSAAESGHLGRAFFRVVSVFRVLGMRDLAVGFERPVPRLRTLGSFSPANGIFPESRSVPDGRAHPASLATAVCLQSAGRRHRGFSLVGDRAGGFPLVCHPYQRLSELLYRLATGIWQRLAGRSGEGQQAEQERRASDFWALRDGSFEIRQGDAVGILSRITPTADVAISKEVVVEIGSWNLQPGASLYCGLWLKDQHGTPVLSTLSTKAASLSVDAWDAKPRPAGLYRSVCRLPANFLNEGRYSVTAIVGRGASDTQVLQEDVVSFDVHDTGLLPRIAPRDTWPGVYWKFEFVSDFVLRISISRMRAPREHLMSNDSNQKR